jgi:hypothetical protein
MPIREAIAQLLIIVFPIAVLALINAARAR